MKPLCASTLSLAGKSRSEVNLVLFRAEFGGCSTEQETQSAHPCKTYKTYASNILREVSRVYNAVEIEYKDAPAQLWFSLM